MYEDPDLFGSPAAELQVPGPLIGRRWPERSERGGLRSVSDKSQRADRFVLIRLEQEDRFWPDEQVRRRGKNLSGKGGV